MTRPGSGHRRWPWVLGIALVLAFAGFLKLGHWQLQRMAWKQALIERVQARVQATPVPAPARAHWGEVSEQTQGYRRVSVVGRFVPERPARTQAVTELGAGVWWLQPLHTDDGDYVWINRGFVPAGQSAAPAPPGRVRVEGLLRLSEPKGGFLRRNDPAQDRWYSRDVVALAQSRGLPVDRVAPFFVDAGPAAPAQTAASAPWPRGGMTVVTFRDAHLSYALTWFGMALLTAIAGWRLVALERRFRQDCARQGAIPNHERSPR